MSYESDLTSKLVEINVALARRNLMPRERQELLKRKMKLYEELRTECYSKSNAPARLKHNLDIIEDESKKRGAY